MKKLIIGCVFVALSATCALAQVSSVPGPNSLQPSSVGISAPGQVQGTATNDNAAAGKVGQYVESVVLSSGAVAVGTATTITSISLTAGDWDIEGNVTYSGTNANVTYLLAGISNTTNNITSGLVGARVDNSYGSAGSPIFGSTTNQSLVIPRTRVSITTTTSYFLVGQTGTTVSTPTGFGFINARRVR